MNVYEALKSGKTEEEVVKNFTDQLNAAKVKLDQEKKEQEKERQEELKSARSIVIADMLDYCDILFGINEEEEELLSNELKDLLFQFEGEIKPLTDINNVIKTGKPNTSDIEVIKQFLDSLK